MTWLREILSIFLKAFTIAKNTKYDRCQRILPSMLYKCFNKKTSGGAVKRTRSDTLATQDKWAINVYKSENMSNQP